MYTIAICNQKGGVGKTTTAINLAAAMAEAGDGVLVVDLDPQHNVAKYYFGNAVVGPTADLYHGMLARSDDVLPEMITEGPNGFDLLLCSKDLAALEQQLPLITDRYWQHVLHDKLRPLEHLYDWVILDCPPSLGILLIEALCAADGMVIPVESEFLASTGLGLIHQTFQQLRPHLNPSLQALGMVVNKYDRGQIDQQQILSLYRDRPHGFRPFDTVIPRRVFIPRASYFHSALVTLAKESNAGSHLREVAELYRRLAQEVMTRARQEVPA